jgi:hypothetical protein
VAEPKTASLIPQPCLFGVTDDGIDRVFSTFDAAAPGFAPASRRQE